MRALAALQGASPRAALASFALVIALGGGAGAWLKGREEAVAERLAVTAPASPVVVNTVSARRPLAVALPEAPPPEPERAPPPPVVAKAAPTRATPPPETGARVGIEGDAEAVALEGEAGHFALPARVPPGTYRILARFAGLDGQGAGSLTVQENNPIHLRCEARFARCVRIP